MKLVPEIEQRHERMHKQIADAVDPLPPDRLSPLAIDLPASRIPLVPNNPPHKSPSRPDISRSESHNTPVTRLPLVPVHRAADRPVVAVPEAPDRPVARPLSGPVAELPLARPIVGPVAELPERRGLAAGPVAELPERRGLAAGPVAELPSDRSIDPAIFGESLFPDSSPSFTSSRLNTFWFH